MSKPVVHLDDWACVVDDRGFTRLHGIATGHPVQPGPHYITASRAVGRRGHLVITASGTQYELLTPKPDYEAMYPDALKRVLSTLPELGDAS